MSFSLSTPITNLATSRALEAHCRSAGLNEQADAIGKILTEAGDKIKFNFSREAQSAFKQTEAVRQAIVALSPPSDTPVAEGAAPVATSETPAAKPAKAAKPPKAAKAPPPQHGRLTGADSAAAKERPSDKAQARADAKKERLRLEAEKRYGTKPGSEDDKTCWCGCGGEVSTGKRFLPGHDAALHSKIRKVGEGLLPAHVVPKRMHAFISTWDHVKTDEREAFFKVASAVPAETAA